MKNLLLFFLLSSCGQYNFLLRESYKIISPEKITEKELVYIYETLEFSDYILIDTRPVQQYNKSHLSNAYSYPLKDLYNITNIPNIRNKKIILYHNKTLYNFQTEKLLDIDISYYKTLRGGINSWTKTNYIINNSN